MSEVNISASDVRELREKKAAKMPNGKSVEEDVVENIATIGENLTLRRMEVLKVSEGAIGSYVHNEVVPNLGKISVLVGLQSSAKDTAKLEALAKQSSKMRSIFYYFSKLLRRFAPRNDDFNNITILHGNTTVLLRERHCT